MGQKVHPFGFRLGVTKTWRSRWFSKQDYSKLLKEDLELKEALLARLKQAGVHDIMTQPIWYGRGSHPTSPAYLTQMRVDPIGFPKDNAPGEYTTNFLAPPAWDAFHQYGESNGVHVSSFSLPGILFSAKPEWASRDANGSRF